MGSSDTTKGKIMNTPIPNSIFNSWNFNALLFNLSLQVNWDKELDEEAEKQRRKKKESQKTTIHNALPPVKKPEVVPQLPKPHSSVSPKPNRPTSHSSATLDLLGLGKYLYTFFHWSCFVHLKKNGKYIFSLIAFIPC